MRELASNILAGMVLGSVVETIAYTMKLWEFTVPGFVLLQIVFVEGVAMGTLSWAIKNNTPSFHYILSACAGGLLEALNAAWFDLWSFPGNSFLFIKGKILIVLTMAFIWGFFCPLVIIMGKRLFEWWERMNVKMV